MNRKQEIDEISQVLRDLKLAHEKTGKTLSDLSRRVENLKDSTRRIVITERMLTLQEYRYSIGKRVRILNPSKGEPNIGTVSAVGKLYITVDLGEGIKRNRIAKNLRLLDDEL